MVISAALAALAKFGGTLLAAGPLQALNFVVSLVVITVLFAAMFKFLPDIQVEWRDVWLGAALTSLLFSIGKFAIGLYLGKTSVASAFGAAGSLVIILVWVYYSAQILFLGAEFTKAYAKLYGSGIRPDSTAIAVTAEARAEQGGRRPDGDGVRA